MKIRDPYIGAMDATRKIRRDKSVERMAGVGSLWGADQVHVSKQGFEIQRARLLAIQAPDVREDLVAEITDVIARGEYRVAGADVVPRMIREHMELAF